MTNGAFLLGVSNQATNSTSLTNTRADEFDDFALELHDNQMPNARITGLYAATYGRGSAIEAVSLRANAIEAMSGRANAIVGTAVAQPDVGQDNILSGVRGRATRAQDRGVHGENSSGGTGVSGVGGQGVYGESTAGGIGVTGYASGRGVGVVGQADTGIGVLASGTYGVSATGNQIGVFAESNASGSIAVQGVSSQGIGVQGISSNNIGVYASGASSGLIATTTEA